MKVFIHPVTKEEIQVTDSNLYSIYERYEYTEKKEKPTKKNTKK